MKTISVSIFCFLVATSTLFSQERTNPKDQDEELGKVAWLRDCEAALSLSKKQGKPVLILFQEVPGCATCRNYGHNVLSNPLLAEAIENEFVPLAIFNNKGGHDAKILKKYGEPSWNNPVVRIVNELGENLVPRVASDYSAKGLYTAMVASLKINGNEVPEYVKLLGSELSATKLKEKTFKMYCFWSGEKQLGSQEGVITTQAGFQSGEVVKVAYDPSTITSETLDAFARKNKMTPVANGTFKWSEKDEDYYLQHSEYKYLPLSALQKTKINAALGNNKNPEKYLSPTQAFWIRNIASIGKEIRFNKDFNVAWTSIE